MVSTLLGLELHTAVSYQVRAENWTWVHWRNSLCFELQEQLLESPVVFGHSNVIGLTKCMLRFFYCIKFGDLVATVLLINRVQSHAFSSLTYTVSLLQLKLSYRHNSSCYK